MNNLRILYYLNYSTSTLCQHESEDVTLIRRNWVYCQSWCENWKLWKIMMWEVHVQQFLQQTNILKREKRY